MSPGGKPAWIGLGSNLGDRDAAIRTAVAALAATPGVEVAAVSRLHDTEPWGEADQPRFLNAVAAIRTTLGPHGLLDACQAVELMGGRLRERRWGPRTIDLDIVAFDDLVLADERLRLPHPLWRERIFVLAPLAEVAPDLVIDGVRVEDAFLHLREDPRAPENS